jgi:hypothetical protein
MKTYYLDANVVIRLSPGGDRAVLGEELLGCVRSGMCQCVSSREQLDELVLFGDPDRRATQLKWSLDVANSQILDCFADLLHTELRSRRPMDLSRALVSPQEASSIAETLRSPRSCDEARARSEAHKRETVARDKKYAEDARRRGKDISSIRVDRESIIEVAREYLNHEYLERIAASAVAPDWDRLVLPRAWFGLFIALCKKRHAQRQIRANVHAGDSHDRWHYCQAAIAGCFVTEDRSLRDTIGMIDWKRVRTISMSELAEEIGRIGAV